jgi:hypothetical protein
VTVLIIIGVLFAVLALTVTLLEKSSFRMSEQEAAKWSRWVWPLVGILLIVQLIMFAF